MEKCEEFIKHTIENQKKRQGTMKIFVKDREIEKVEEFMKTCVLNPKGTTIRTDELQTRMDAGRSSESNLPSTIRLLEKGLETPKRNGSTELSPMALMDRQTERKVTETTTSPYKPLYNARGIGRNDIIAMPIIDFNSNGNDAMNNGNPFHPNAPPQATYPNNGNGSYFPKIKVQKKWGEDPESAVIEDWFAMFEEVCNLKHATVEQRLSALLDNITSGVME